MPPFPLFGRAKLRALAGQFRLQRYVPHLSLQGLTPGIDNLHPDVYLSKRLVEVSRQHLANLIEQFGEVQQLMRAPESKPFGDSPYGRAHIKDAALPQPTSDLPALFKNCVRDLQLAALRKAREAGEIRLDLLCQLALRKFLHAEIALQYSATLERCKENLRLHAELHWEKQAAALRDRLQRFQVNKRLVLRRVVQNLRATFLDVEREAVANTRQSLFGEHLDPGYVVLDNRLEFPEAAQDAVVRAEHYAMFGSFDRDPDQFERVARLACRLLLELGLATGESEAREMLSQPENAKLLMFTGLSDNSSRGRAQLSLTKAWAEMLDEAGIMEYALAAYEVVSLLGDYAALVPPQQLKLALVQRSERQQAETLLVAQRCSLEKLHAAVRRVRSASATARLRAAARYLIDLMNFYSDLRKIEEIERNFDGINLLTNERLRELSEINDTLYEFLLPPEERRSEQQIAHHVILKADVRDSTKLTRALLARGLNPASFFSLNFFDPVTKRLAKYGAQKVFIEGDALILSRLGQEGANDFAVARTCALAGEILDVVAACEHAAVTNGLPRLELGIGIAYQNSAPLYLLDGSHRIMISDALNLSDRLSACHKRARRFFGDPPSLCRVLVFQPVDSRAADGAEEDARLNYNVGGIHLSASAFAKLREEISFQQVQAEVPLPWKESVRMDFYRGLVPLGAGVFHPLLVREGRVAQIELGGFRVLRWTDLRYYEVCTDPRLIERVDAVS